MHNRRFRRVPFEAEVRLTFKQNSWSCELLDVAMKGALLASPTPLALSHGNICRLCITLPGSPIALDFQAEMVHCEKDQYGFKFISEDLETLTHLRKLIELNTGDAEATRSELTTWLTD